MDGLVISGGALKGLAALGYLEKNKHILKDVKWFSGSSVGSIIVCLLACGWGPLELFNIFCSETDPLKNFSIGKISGLVDPKPFFDRIEKMLSIKNISTFGDYNKYDTNVCVCCTDCHDRNAHYFSSFDTPHVSVIAAIRASCSIPVLFTPVQIDEKMFIDGSASDNIPIKPIRNYCFQIIVIWLQEEFFDPKTIIDYAHVAMNTLVDACSKHSIETHKPEYLEIIKVPKNLTFENIFFYGKSIISPLLPSISNDLF